MNKYKNINRWNGYAILLCLNVWIFCGCGPRETENSQEAGNQAEMQAAEGAPCVVVSTTDLKGIVEAIGGNKLELHCFGKGNQDPHDLDILPSYLREMNDADLWIQVGNDIEAAWYPDLISNMTNPKILEGKEGFMDVAEGLNTLEGMVGDIMGVGHQSGLHPSGNPHYLLDPIEGIRVAEAVAKRLSELVPAEAEYFDANLKKFRSDLANALIGEALAARHDVVRIADMYMADTLDAFLKEQGHGIPLGGWLGALKPYRGKPVVGDHDLWPYFCRRIGLAVLGYFEPEPGVPPTSKHLKLLVEQMKAQSVKIILSAPYFDDRHARFVSDNTGAKALPMCHQTQARPGTDGYLDMVRHNMETMIQGLKDAYPEGTPTQ